MSCSDFQEIESKVETLKKRIDDIVISSKAKEFLPTNYEGDVEKTVDLLAYILKEEMKHQSIPPQFLLLSSPESDHKQIFVPDSPLHNPVWKRKRIQELFNNTFPYLSTEEKPAYLAEIIEIINPNFIKK
jgi:GR25 family glycosyltransferase involved in LPS biosynthesis